MGKKAGDTQDPKGISRRDFLKAGAAAAAAGGTMDFVYSAQMAAAYEGSAGYTISTTTCPYCSASCGQRVAVNNSTGDVADVYGDFMSPLNSGGLCSKGAGSYQLVMNERRLGYPTAGAHPVNAVFKYDAAYADGIAYKRTGNGAWAKMALSTALTEIVAGDGGNNLGMLAYRASDAVGWNPGAGSYNSKSVAFFGSSHLNNEPCYVYRKLIANFGTSNVEHQARI